MAAKPTPYILCPHCHESLVEEKESPTPRRESGVLQEDMFPRRVVDYLWDNPSVELTLREVSEQIAHGSVATHAVQHRLRAALAAGYIECVVNERGRRVLRKPLGPRKGASQ